MDDPSLMPVRPKAEPRAEAPPLSAEEARRAALWLRWHFRAAAGLVAISAVVLLLVLGDYGGPFWAAVGLTLIGATLAFIGTMAMASRLSDAAARTGALTGAGLIGATCAGYIYLVTVGTLNLELGSLPLHTLALFLLGGLGSLAVYGFAVARLTGSARARRPALATVGAASVIAAILGAAMVGLIPNSEGLALSLLAPLGTHLTTVRATRLSLVAYANERDPD